MFRGNHFHILLLTISLAACIPNLSIAADITPTDVKTTNSPTDTTGSPVPVPVEPNPSMPAQTSPAPTSTPNTTTSITPSETAPSQLNPAPMTTPSQTAAPTPSISPSTTPTTPSANSTTPAPTTTTTTSTTVTTTTMPTKPNANSSTNLTASNDIQVSAAEKQKAIMDFLKKAADYIKEKGKDNALAEFNKPDSIFSKDSLYVFAVQYDGTILATQSFEQKLLGTNQSRSEDPDGVTFIQSLIEKAKSGGGWVLYKTENPVSKIVECKNAYVMPGNISGSSDYLIGTGYYYPISASGKCEE